MSESTRLDRIASVAVLVSAVVVAGMVTYRSLRPATTVSANALPPREVEKDVWEEIVAAGIHVGGNRAAPITIVEFTDLECPACRGYQATLEEVVASRPDKVRLLYVPFPLTYHRFAIPAARAANCATEVGALSAWIRAVYDGQDSLGLKSWGGFARSAGILDTARIAACAGDTSPSEAVATGLRLGGKLGSIGTPTLLVEGTLYSEPPSKDMLVEAIDRVGATASPTAPTFSLTGMVLDSVTGAPVSGALVTLVGFNNEPIATATADARGQFVIEAANGRYHVLATHRGYGARSTRAAEFRPPLNPMGFFIAPERRS